MSIHQARPHITSLTFDTTTRSFICTSAGSPATTVTWTRDGQPLSIDGTRHQLTQTVTNRAASTYENKLTIADSAFKSAIYKCNVTNVLGYTNATFSVKGMLQNFVWIKKKSFFLLERRSHRLCYCNFFLETNVSIR